ncbi:peptide/nickel transport system substrate-binding protein [Propionibacteriaceae bacterium ES.041]|nr:peptide/nickel transport system substrate-binding protein [Propionibacteriaceae bacterium ES.041]TDO92641.1 peptide/nickel transport system substrate-binding protein [Enemella evansiae]
MGVSRKVAVAAALTAALLALPGCAPAGQSGGAGGQGGQGGEANKNFSFYLYQKATGINPYDAGGGADQTLVHLVFQPLLTWANGKYEGRLAESWDFAQDGKTFTFNLKKDGKWSDGKPITAPDLKWALESHLDKKTGSYINGYLGSVKGAQEFRNGQAQEVTGITAPDDTTLKIELNTPNVGFPALLTEAALAPKHVYESIPRDQWKGNQAFREPKVGSGPFLFSRWISDDQTEFTANPGYVPKPKMDKVYAKYLTGDVAAAQLGTGEIDAAEIPAADVKSMKSDPNITVVQKPGNRAMTLHTVVTPTSKLKDQKVRQAIMYAIDRQGIVDSVIGGEGKALDAYLFAPDWVVPPNKNPYNRDVNKAKQLLQEANWDPNTEVNLQIVPGQADRDAVMRIVVGNLTEAGIKAKITPVTAADSGKLVTDGTFDVLISPLTMAVPEPSLLATRVTCAQRSPNGANIARYCNPELDALMAEGQSTDDQAKRQQAYQKAYMILNTDVMNFPLYSPTLNWGTGKSVNGFDPSANPITATAAQWGK